MKFHLVSYATSKYRHRQMFLKASALANGIVESATSWTVAKLGDSGFLRLAPDLSLSERGSGFWAWKPFIIQKAIESVGDGEFVIYCDVGRKYPYILLDHPLDPFVNWMDDRGQDMIPGILIPWNGPMSMWTKRDAFTGTGVDGSGIRSAFPIQASFSLWRASPMSRGFVAEWLSWCVQRRLVSDDPSEDGAPEAPGFRGHRHDQSLLTLCCLKHGVLGMDLGPDEPSFNERDPGLVSKRVFASKRKATVSGNMISLLAKPVQMVERALRKHVRFGRRYE